MSPVAALVALTALIGAVPAAAQVPADPCAAAAPPPACLTEAEEDAWERLSRELNDLAADAVLQGGTDRRRDVAAAGAEARRQRELQADAALPSRADETGHGGVEDPQRLRHAVRYRETLQLLQERGLSWGEACPLAAVHAYGGDWVSESRRCVTTRLGVRSSAEFVGALVAHGAPPEEACVAAERYWNGLSVPAAEDVCAGGATP